MRNTRMTLALINSTILVCLVLASRPGRADDNDNHHLLTASVLFGRGLNTALPGNAVNHAILPSDIKIKVGSVVDFGVAGFHDIIVFKPGVTLDDLINAGGGQFPVFPPVFVMPPDPTTPLPSGIAFLADKIYYRGINPAGGPPQPPSTGNPTNSFNRSEPVAFLEAGTYLVICNVRPHLLDGMYRHRERDARSIAGRNLRSSKRHAHCNGSPINGAMGPRSRATPTLARESSAKLTAFPGALLASALRAYRFGQFRVDLLRQQLTGPDGAVAGLSARPTTC